MKLHEYQKQATRTIKEGPKQQQLVNFGLGITGEAGEVADIIKKHVFHGHELNKQELIKELGDVLWYVAGIASTINVSLEDIAFMNLDKLLQRYPDGFSESHSIHRKEYSIMKPSGIKGVAIPPYTVSNTNDAIQHLSGNKESHGVSVDFNNWIVKQMRESNNK